jgi:hypothetical protein
LQALRRAARIALDEARKSGTPCHVWQDGKIVDIAAAARRQGARK